MDARLKLYEHNIEAYEKVCNELQNSKISAIIHATGTGKSYIGLQLALDNKNKKTLYIVPTKAIIEHIDNIIKDANLNKEVDFPNLEVRTYSYLCHLTSKQLKELDIDLLVLDEFHHIGAPIWGNIIEQIIKSHKNILIFGMTAYSIRERGTINERDMVNPYNDELFSNKEVSTYDLCDAIIDGVLCKFIYKSAYIHLIDYYNKLEEKALSIPQTQKSYQKIEELLKIAKRKIHEAPSVKDVFKQNIKKDGKYFYFCPTSSVEGENDIETIMATTKEWIREMNLTEDDYVLYKTTSLMRKEGKRNRDAFYKDEDLSGNKVDNKLRIMFTINQYNDGVHAPGVDGVILGRGTKSDIVFFEQLGRALSTSRDTKKEYEELSQKTTEELYEISKIHQIEIDKKMSRELLIEKIISPIIIDLAGNINFIKELENKLTERVKERKNKKEFSSRKIYIGTTAFDITMLNEEMMELLQTIKSRMFITWDSKYELAKKFYEHYGHLRIPSKFATLDGINYDINGIKLGLWLENQKQAYKNKVTNKISPKQIELLQALGVDFESDFHEERWLAKFELVKKYFGHYGNLNIPYGFKTLNGVDYDENGENIYLFIANQRYAYNGKGKAVATKEHVELLKNLGVKFELYNKEEEFNRKYILAKKYYEHYGNLLIKDEFKTKNGIDYDENGEYLYKWITNLRARYTGSGEGNMSMEKIKMLEDIQMRWFTWFNNNRLLSEEINSKTITRKKKEILNRFKSLLVTYDSSTLPSKEELNEEFIKRLSKQNNK